MKAVHMFYKDQDSKMLDKYPCCADTDVSASVTNNIILESHTETNTNSEIGGMIFNTTDTETKMPTRI